MSGRDEMAIRLLERNQQLAAEQQLADLLAHALTEASRWLSGLQPETVDRLTSEALAAHSKARRGEA